MQDPVIAALYRAASDLLTEARSTAQRVPTDPRERRGYRKAMRYASRQLADWAHALESDSPAAAVKDD